MSAADQFDQHTDIVGIVRLVALGTVPIPILSAFLVGGPILTVAISGLLFGGIAFAARGVRPSLRSLPIALSLIGQCIALTAAFAGHRWQLDTHMTFFAMLAIIATMGSIPALLFAVVVTAVHHLLMGLVLPALVYPVSDLSEVILRTLLHAGIVVFEAAILAWSMQRSARAAAEIRASREQLAQHAAEAAQARAAAEAARERAIAAADRTRQEGQTAASAVEQIASVASAAASSAAHAQKVVAKAKGDAESSDAVVRRAMEAMKAIEESAGQISAIVAVIDDISRQTDIPALNAAVEAARAGEAGRGFAVVANEIRVLAQRSADATQQIRTLVSTSGARVVEGVELVGETREALSRIVDEVGNLNELVRGIAYGAVEQSEGLAQVNRAIAKIDSMVEAEDGPEATIYQIRAA